MSVTFITPLILTFNEAPNIRRTLEKLAWARQILVVDSFSTDETLDIVKSFPQARVVQRKFDDHTTQWNFGLDQIKTEWVLSLDADYVLTDDLVQELRQWKPDSQVNAYFARFKYCVSARPLRASLYPARAVLFRVKECRYEPDGHTQKLVIRGATANLSGLIFHDDRKPLARWLQEQDRYARIEAEYLLGDGRSKMEVATTDHRPPLQSPLRLDRGEGQGEVSNSSSNFQLPTSKLTWPDRVRQKVVLAPFLVFFYTLLGKGLILDGWPGWYYVFQRTLAELMLSLKLIEQKLKR
jgi:glycosyltransferase involved in cell wall biosynthesis